MERGTVLSGVTQGPAASQALLPNFIYIYIYIICMYVFVYDFLL